MKIAAFDRDGVTMIGRVDATGKVLALAAVDDFWRDPLARRAAGGKQSAGNLSALRQRPAVPRSAKIICVGLNYRAHAKEVNLPIPQIPIIFSRWASTLSSDGDPAPRIDDKYDYEGELGVVIGRRMFRVSEEQAAAGIFGYAAFNDLSARTFQTQTPQWSLGKNSDASGPMSPIVTADEVGDPAKGLRLVTRVNGSIVQDGNTSDMIFSVPSIIAHLSQVMTLEPGDVIATGTPPGVGMNTGVFLRTGDEVAVEIEKIGSVRTPIAEPPATIF